MRKSTLGRRTIVAIHVAAMSSAVNQAAAARAAELPRTLSAQSAGLYAVVDAAGGLVAGSGVAGVSQVGTGQYEVTFVRNVAACSFVATARSLSVHPMTSYTAGGRLSSQGVYVEMKNQFGELMNTGFDLLINCGGPGMAYAVVGYAAELVRGTPGTSLASLGFGRYRIRFQSAVADCAFVATVGDPARGLVLHPAGVYTGSGPDNRTVYIETKNTGGGLQSGVPFHLAVVCPSAPGARIAVVQSDGLPRRASALTSSFRDSGGFYQVVTNLVTAPCATVATRGSVDGAVPFTPATVEVLPTQLSNSMRVVSRSIFLPADYLNEAFHAAIVCGT